MTNPPEDVDWGDVDAPVQDANLADLPNIAKQMDAAVFPEFSDNPHNHRMTISIDSRGPHVCIRGNTAAEIIAAYNELDAYGFWPVIGSAYTQLTTSGRPAPAPAAPSQSAPPPAAPAGPQGWQTPQTGPPFGDNVSAPQAPGYVGPPMPPQGGGYGQQQGNNGRAQPKPRPAGWAMVDVPYNDKGRFKAMREPSAPSGAYLKGKIQWGGGGNYWISPDVAQWVAQQGFPVQQ